MALDHTSGSNCPSSPCTLVSGASYKQGLKALLGRYPWITEIEAWNEPNDNTEPTANDPAVAAAYYEAARSVCPSCTVIAGDFLDGPSLQSYMQGYQRALTESPSVWGLHDYFDATYFEKDGVDTLLAATSGDVWLTETGGLVANGDLAHDEGRAAQSVSWLYGLASVHPRISHMFFYGWLQGDDPSGFDSGLLRNDGTPRPAYWAIRAHTNPSLTNPAQPPSRPPAGSAVGAHPVISGRFARLLSGRALRIAVACVGGGQGDVCRGKTRVRVGADLRSVAFAVRTSHVGELTVKITARAVATLRSERSAHVAAQLCTLQGCGHAQRLAVIKPKTRR